jgi:hypothetical protein
MENNGIEAKAWRNGGISGEKRRNNGEKAAALSAMKMNALSMAKACGVSGETGESKAA